MKRKRLVRKELEHDHVLLPLRKSETIRTQRCSQNRDDVKSEIGFREGVVARSTYSSRCRIYFGTTAIRDVEGEEGGGNGRDIVDFVESGKESLSLFLSYLCLSSSLSHSSHVIRHVT